MLLKISLAISFLVFCDAASRQKRIVGGYPALIPEANGFTISQPPKESDNIILMEDEYRSASIIGTEEPEGYYAFKGLRYAKPPVEKLRFQRPERLFLSGEIDATKYGPPCLQIHSNTRKIIGSEDCLFLNVYTPLNKSTENLPVFFWIHGGGFHSGSALQYGPAHLVKHNIIVVTVQYRLGSLGWLTSNLKELPGNVGLFDLQAAIVWVQKYISYFKGDPQQVVLSGQGSGASAAMLLSVSDFTKGMISGVFAMSGNPLSAFAVDPAPKRTYKNMTTLLGCDQLKSLEAVRCLQQLSIEQIINCDSKFENNKLQEEGYLAGLASLLTAGPSVEGFNDGRFLPYFLQDSPLFLLKKKKIPKIPMLTGVNKLETKSGILGKFRNEVLNKLTKIPDYINNVLPLRVLNTNSGLFKNGTVIKDLKTLFENNNYLKLITSKLGNSIKDLEKVIQGTSDALFNLPAFFTSHLWSRRSNVFFYSFEHKSNIKSPGKWFLPNILGDPDKEVPKNNAEDNGESGHGDELIYLYDVRSIDGSSIPGAELVNKKDIEMRNNFTSLVAKFIRNGKPSLKILGDEWPTFTSSKQSDYVVLDENPRIQNKFRFCEMGLWGGVPDILQSKDCDLPGISDILKTVPGLINNDILGEVAEGTVNLLGNPLNKISGLLQPSNTQNGLLGGNLLNNNKNGQNGLLGGVTGTLGIKQENKKPSVVTQKPNPLGGLSNLFGKPNH